MCICLSYVYLFISFVFVVSYVYLLYLCVFVVSYVYLLYFYVYLLYFMYLLYSYVYLLYYVCIDVLTLDAGLLAGSQYPEGPATGHLDTGFSWFPCVYKRMLRWFPSFQLLLHASHVALPT